VKKRERRVGGRARGKAHSSRHQECKLFPLCIYRFMPYSNICKLLPTSLVFELAASSTNNTSTMARTETPKKRVSNLVGRFEQLAQSSPVQEPSNPASPTSPLAPSHHIDKKWLSYDRRALSLSSMPSAPCLSVKLERELTRNAKLRNEIEELRSRCTESDDVLTLLSQRLEEGTELQASLHMQTSGLQTKVDRLADKLARRDKIQKAEYERRIIAVANERDMLASKLRMADASVERARVLQEVVETADERARIADEKAQIASNRISTLRKQLMELKKDTAARSGTPADVSDQEVLDMMNKLNHLVQNWCVSSFRKIKIGMCAENVVSEYMLTCSRSTQDDL